MNTKVEGSSFFFIEPPQWVTGSLLPQLVKLGNSSATLSQLSMVPAVLSSFSNSFLAIHVPRMRKGAQWIKDLNSIRDLLAPRNNRLILWLRDVKDPVVHAFRAIDPNCIILKDEQSVQLAFKAFIGSVSPLLNRGQRAHVRIGQPYTDKASFNIHNSGVVYDGKISDFSIGAMACFFPQPLPFQLKERQVLPQMQLKLNGHLVLVDGLVGAKREHQGRETFIVAFRNPDNTATLSKMAAFVAQGFQAQIEYRFGSVQPSTVGT